MTEKSRPWDGILLGDATEAPYSAAEWASFWALLHGEGTAFPNYGVLKGTGDGTYTPLDVHQTSVASTNVEVAIGAALVHGRLYEDTAASTLAIAANASGNARIDTVILRLDTVAQTIRLVVKQGTPAASPARPTLTQSATTWEMPLADIAVASGFSTIVNANISPRQRSVQMAQTGWQPFCFALGSVISNVYTATSESLATGNAIAIPFTLSSNMLIDSLVLVCNTNSLAYNLSWGLFVQDTNDAATAENTLRRLGSGSGSGTNLLAGDRVTLSATTPFAVSPGTYWMVVVNNAAGTFTAGVHQTGLESVFNLYQTFSGSFTLAQTANLVTSWTGKKFAVGAMLKGRVFGQTVAF